MHRIVFFTGLRVQPDRVELEPTTRLSSQSSRCVGANAFLALVAHWAFASLLPAQRALGSAQLTAAMRLPRSPVGGDERTQCKRNGVRKDAVSFGSPCWTLRLSRWRLALRAAQPGAA